MKIFQAVKAKKGFFLLSVLGGIVLEILLILLSYFIYFANKNVNQYVGAQYLMILIVMIIIVVYHIIMIVLLFYSLVKIRKSESAGNKSVILLGVSSISTLYFLALIIYFIVR
ncbi:MAG: hypothetical protein FJ216_01275 [Ignavibacteria bacterium]|nr:hypothetical protein [Ignavibacteria bacterium]